MDEAHALAARLLRGAPIAARAMKEVAMRSQQLSSVEAIRFGETMRIVATQRQQEANVAGTGSAWSPPGRADQPGGG
jgi:enoyl-CoA hydratase/carnithine racemase